MSYRYPVMEKPAQESWRSGFEEQDVELGDDAASLVRAVPLATSARRLFFVLFGFASSIAPKAAARVTVLWRVASVVAGAQAAPEATPPGEERERGQWPPRRPRRLRCDCGDDVRTGSNITPARHTHKHPSQARKAKKRAKHKRESSAKEGDATGDPTEAKTDAWAELAAPAEKPAEAKPGVWAMAVALPHK